VTLRAAMRALVEDLQEKVAAIRRGRRLGGAAQNLSSKTAALMGRTKTPPADQAQTFARLSSCGGWRDLSLDLRNEFASARARS
jgi:hypothetical protein